jgi:polyferredoxin
MSLLALAAGLAVVQRVSNGRKLSDLRRVIAVLVGLAATVVFLDYHDAVPASLKHALTSVQFVPSVWDHHGDIPAWLQGFPPEVAAFYAGVAVAFAGAFLLLLLTFVFGRVYCSVICPLGILQDVFSRLTAWTRREFFKKKPVRLPFRPPLAVLRQSILVFVVLAVLAGWSGVALAWFDPYSHFGRIVHGVFQPLLLLANNGVVRVLHFFGSNALPRSPVPWAGLGALLPPLLFLSVVAVISALRGRLYCNALCPVGTLLGWVSRVALFRISIDKTSCVRCGECTRVCKAQCIDLRTQTVDASRCVACFNCVSSCDEGGIHLNWLGKAKAKGKLKLPERTKPAASPADASPIPVPASQPVFTRRAFVAGVGGAAVVGGAEWFGAKLSASPDDPKNRVVSPPGALSRVRFVGQCTGCLLCVSACPSHVLEPALTQYGSFSGFMKPRMNYSRSFCNIDCVRCGEVCPDGALQHLVPQDKPRTRIGLAKVTLERCIVRRDNTACGACGEHCPTAALQMITPKGGKFPEPVVNETQCIGCGACEYICPARPEKAVVIHGLAVHEKASELKQEAVKAATPVDEFPF